VYFGSRSPDGTIYLNRDSKDGKGFGWDEVMTLELDRLDGRYARVVVGVLIQQRTESRTFAGVLNPGFRLREGYTVLTQGDFGDGDKAELAKRYPGAQSRDYDGNPGRLTEMDALIAYLQMLGTQVDFKKAAARETAK